jgi:hypothetical protein
MDVSGTDFLDVVDCLDEIVDNEKVNQLLKEMTKDSPDKNLYYILALYEIFNGDLKRISKTYAYLFDLGVKWVYKGVVKYESLNEVIEPKISTSFKADDLTESYDGNKTAFLSNLFERSFYNESYPSRILFIGSKTNSAVFEYENQYPCKFATEQEIHSARIFQELGLYPPFERDVENRLVSGDEYIINFGSPLYIQDFSWDVLQEYIKILESVCKQYKITDVSIESFVKYRYFLAWYPALIGCHIEAVEKQDHSYIRTNPILIQRISDHVEMLLYTIDYEKITSFIKTRLKDTYSNYLTQASLDYLENGTKNEEQEELAKKEEELMPCLPQHKKLNKLSTNVYQEDGFMYKIYQEDENELYFIKLLKDTGLIPEVFSFEPCSLEGKPMILVKEAKYEGTLTDFIKTKRDVNQLTDAFTQIVHRALILSKQLQVTHGDFGPNNIVYKTNDDGTFDWRFIDFEYARQWDEGKLIRGEQGEWNPYADVLSLLHSSQPPSSLPFRLVGDEVDEWDRKFLANAGEADIEYFDEVENANKSLDPIIVHV